MNTSLIILLAALSVTLVAASLCQALMIMGSRRKLLSLERQFRQLSSELGGRIQELGQVSTGPAREPEPLEPDFDTPVYSQIQASERMKISRLHRMGRSEEQIAQAVNLPAANVRMILKIQEFAQKGWTNRSSRAPLAFSTETTEQTLQTRDIESDRVKGVIR